MSWHLESRGSSTLFTSHPWSTPLNTSKLVTLSLVMNKYTCRYFVRNFFRGFAWETNVSNKRYQKKVNRATPKLPTYDRKRIFNRKDLLKDEKSLAWKTLSCSHQHPINPWYHRRGGYRHITMKVAFPMVEGLACLHNTFDNPWICASTLDP